MEHERPPVAPSPGPKRPRGDSLAVPESTGKMGGLWLEVGRLREEAEQHEHKLQDAVRDATKALKKEAETLREQLAARDTLIDTLQAALAAAATAHTSFAGAQTQSFPPRTPWWYPERLRDPRQLSPPSRLAPLAPADSCVGNVPCCRDARGCVAAGSRAAISSQKPLDPRAD